MSGGAGVRRDGPANLCQSEEDAWQESISKHKATERLLKWVNSPENEKAVKKLGITKSIAEWSTAVRKAADANKDAALEVGKAFEAHQKCKKKHGLE
jgi:uncharacterized protein YaiL (DUF2058 family)